MADRLLTAMVTEYNSYKFPTDDIETTLYRVTPVYDSAGRAVPFCEFTIGLKWLVKNAEATDAAVQELVRKLTAPAGELLYEGRGLAFPTVNIGRVKDVAWGPKPGPVTLRPVGAGRATEAEWQVTWRAPVCADATFAGVAEWNFAVSYTLDADGVSTRTTRGHVTVANNRSSATDRRVRTSADFYRENVVPPLLPGFKRESQNYDLSEDKSTLNYEVVDRELGGNTPGPGLTSAECSETVVNPIPRNGYLWMRTVRGSYTLAPGRGVIYAWNAFFRTVFDRMGEMRKNIPGVNIVPVTFNVEDPNLYGTRQKVNLSITLQIASATLSDMLGGSGLWTPVPNSSWRAWVTDLKGPLNDPFGARGSAGLEFNVGDDALIDLCKKTAVPAGKGEASLSAGIRPSSAVILAAEAIQAGFGAKLAARFPAPTPAASWLHYEVYARVVLDTGAVLTKTLPARPLERAPGTGGVWDVLRDGLPAGVKAVVPPVVKTSANRGNRPPADTGIQHRTTPTAHVYLTGRAARYGFDIPHPQVVSVGNLPATLMTTGRPDEGFVSGVVGGLVYPVFAAQWNLHYVVPGLTAGGAPPNPYLDPGGRA